VLTYQILQLTSLLPTAEHFSILLRDALKAQVGYKTDLCPGDELTAQLAPMKQLKPFLPSFYSEFLIAGPSTQPNVDKHDSLLLGSEIGEKLQQHLDGEGDLRGPGSEGKGEYQRVLGETFGFPGDARKMRERSKMKLWREYFIGELDIALLFVA
jgi:hypothetical protein